MPRQEHASLRPCIINYTPAPAAPAAGHPTTLRASSARPVRPGWPTRLSRRGSSSTMCITEVHSLRLRL